MKNSNASGVYSITNLVNGKFYIGSAINFSVRYRLHVSGLRRGAHDSSKLQRAWSKHGEGNFEFKILACCDRANVIFYEQQVLDALAPFGNAGYNIRRIAESNFGIKMSTASRARMAAANFGRKASAETRLKMSLSKRSMTEETKKKMSLSRTGKKRDPAAVAKTADAKRGTRHTPESIAKMSASHKNMSDETRARLSDAAKRMSPETRAKIGLASRNISDATRLKMSNSKKNMSQAQRDKIGEANRSRSPESIAGMRAKKIGVKQSPEHIASRLSSRAENRAKRCLETS